MRPARARSTPRGRWPTAAPISNLADPDGTTALVLAIINAHYDVAALLLEKGADPNVADVTGMAALYAAVDMNTLAVLPGRPAPKPSGSLTPWTWRRRCWRTARIRTPGCSKPILSAITPAATPPSARRDADYARRQGRRRAR